MNTSITQGPVVPEERGCEIFKKNRSFLASSAENAYVCNEVHTVFRGGRSSLFLRAFFMPTFYKIFGFRPPCGALMRPQLPRKVCTSTGKRKPFLFSVQNILTI